MNSDYVESPTSMPAPVSEGRQDDPPALVDQMVAAGEWPKPELLRRILAAGEAAVEPLVAVLRTNPRGWPEEAPIWVATGLLSMLATPAAVPALADIVKRYDEETSYDAAEALPLFGEPGFEALLELPGDPSLTGYKLTTVLSAAMEAAGDDRGRKSRVAEVNRRILGDRMAKARERLGRKGKRHDNPPLDPDDGLDDVETPHKLSLVEEISFIISNLASLADPLARDLVNTAFREKLVSEAIVDQAIVDDLYRHGQKFQVTGKHSEPDWLSFYEESYEAEFTKTESETAQPPQMRQAAPVFEIAGSAPDLPKPIRNTGSRLGRNDPCWCGSGKKYKKCHLKEKDSG